MAYLRVIKGETRKSVTQLGYAIWAGVLFTIIQLIEYKRATFTIGDRVFGSRFFTLTGFHGLHVLVGTLILFIQKIRLRRSHFSATHNVGLLAAV